MAGHDPERSRSNGSTEAKNFKEKQVQYELVGKKILITSNMKYRAEEAL